MLFHLLRALKWSSVKVGPMLGMQLEMWFILIIVQTCCQQITRVGIYVLFSSDPFWLSLSLVILLVDFQSWLAYLEYCYTNLHFPHFPPNHGNALLQLWCKPLVSWQHEELMSSWGIFFKMCSTESRWVRHLSGMGNKCWAGHVPQYMAFSQGIRNK